MNICEDKIDLTKLVDSTIEEIPIKIGYNSIKFKYEYNIQTEKNIYIPNIIHFIWIGSLIKDKYINSVLTCKKINKLYDVYLWVDDKSLNNDIKTQLEINNITIKNLYETIFDSLKWKQNHMELLPLIDNYGYKADIFRLYVVYEYGGIYSDIDSIWIKPLDHNFSKEFVTYRIDKQCSNITNSFFGFSSKSTILYNAINNLDTVIQCFLKLNNKDIIHSHIPVISGPQHLTKIIKDTNPSKLNYIHQGFCVIGGPHEDIYSYYFSNNNCYCFQTFDKNWCS